MEQPINLLIINLALLALNLAGAFWMSRKINNLNKAVIKPKVKKYPDAIQEIYDGINFGLKSNKESIELVVDNVPMNWFVPLYHGLTKFYGFKLDLKVRYLSKDKYSEYLVVDLNSYKGSIHKPLEPKLIFEKETYYWDEEVEPVQKQVSGLDSIPFPVKKTKKSNQPVISNNSFDNVIDFNSYKNKRNK